MKTLWSGWKSASMMTDSLPLILTGLNSGAGGAGIAAAAQRQGGKARRLLRLLDQPAVVGIEALGPGERPGTRQLGEHLALAFRLSSFVLRGVPRSREGDAGPQSDQEDSPQRSVVHWQRA